jgi:hypothetical protein
MADKKEENEELKVLREGWRLFLEIGSLLSRVSDPTLFLRIQIRRFFELRIRIRLLRWLSRFQKITFFKFFPF